MKNINLKKARLAKGLTQEKLANMLSYQKSTISNWENGYSTPSIKDAFRVSKILDASIKDLFFDHEVQVFHTSKGS